MLWWAYTFLQHSRGWRQLATAGSSAGALLCEHRPRCPGPLRQGVYKAYISPACGTGNPEEGELRPQLLDRFGMHAEIRTVKDPNLRVQIVEQRADFDADPAGFRTSYGATQHDLTDKITAARKMLKEVPAVDRRLPANFAGISSTLCRRMAAHRACRLRHFCLAPLACARGAA